MSGRTLPGGTGATGLLIALAFGGTAALTLARPSVPTLLIIAIAGVLSVPIITRIARRQLDPFEPIVLFVAAYGVMFVLRPLSEIADGKYEYPIGPATVAFRDGFEPMLVIALIGAIAFVAGYMLPAGRRVADRIAPPPREYSPQVAQLVAAGVAVIGFMFFAAFLIVSGPDALAVYLSGRSARLTDLLASSNKYLVFGPIVLLPASVMLLALGTVHRSAGALLAGTVSVLALVVVAAPTGSRSLLLPVFISGAIYYYLTKQRRPSWVGLVVVLMMLLAVSSILVSGRNSVPGSDGGFQAAAGELAGDPARMFDSLTEDADSAEATGLAALLSLAPGRLEERRGGAVIGDLLARPIPRAVWEGKPLPPRQDVTRALFGRYADTLLANPEFSVLLYPYLDGGLIGVAVLMLLYGIAARALYLYALKHVSSVAVRLGFALLMPAFIAGVRDSPVDTIARLAFFGAPLVAAFGLGSLAVSRRRSQPRPRPVRSVAG